MGMGPSPAARAAAASSSNGRPNGTSVGGSGKQPLSIEAILAQQKAEKEAASRPKFLSKEERAALAIEKRAAEVAAEKAKVAELAARRDELERQAREARYADGRPGPSSSRPPAYGNRDGRGPPPSSARGAGPPQGVPTGPKAMRGNQRPLPPGSKERPEPASATIPTGPGRPSMSMPPPPPSMPPPPPPSSMGPPALPASATVPDANGNSVMPGWDEPMLASAPTPELNQKLLQARYLGKPDNKKRRTKKASDKKFIFDWHQDDDTGLTEVDPLYRVATAPPKGRGQETVTNNASGASGSGYGIYGGGRMAGLDPSDQTSQRSAAPRQITLGEGEEVLTSQPILKSNGGKKSAAALNELHWSEKPLSAMKERDWRIFREDFSIAARGGNIPHPLRNWNESTIPVQILQIIDEVGYKEPSPIQRQALPLGLNNRDIIGIAETGSGKTASFVIPMLTYIGKLPPLTDDNRHLGPYALILAPTRELAQQIEVEASKFATRLGYRCVSIVGGKQMEEQALALRDGAEIIIATPGRLKDCIERHVLVLAQCTYVVMDEADRMINLGFEEVVNFLLDQLPLSNQKPDTAEAEDSDKMTQFVGGVQGIDKSGASGLYRQTVMFSATMPPAVERLARKYLRRPAVVTIGVAGQAVDTVEQKVEFLPNEDKKRGRLLEVLNSGWEPPIIVFVNQKKTADQLAKEIGRAGWSATTLHSGKNQEQREQALASLRSGDADILVATDLAGRGIDVPDVSLVVNFQMAGTIEAYVHRIGRTGRAGKLGTAITFLTNDDAEVLYDLKQEITKSPVSRCPPELARHEAAQSKQTAAMKRRAADLDD